MDIRRRVLRAGAVLGIALAAGHLVQTVKQVSSAASQNSASLDGQVSPSASSVFPVSASLGGVNDIQAEVTGITSLAASTAGGCAATLALTAEANAMIGVVLTAPCNPGERVVLRHSGLNFTARTSADGVVAVTLPAFEVEAEVFVFDSQSELARASVTVAEAAEVRRFALGWMSEDVINLRVSERDMVFVSNGGTRDAKGYQKIMAFGDGTVATPILAEVYSYPADAEAMVEIQVELSVTPGNCGRDIALDVLTARNGVIETSKVSVAVPPCDAAGDILVLKNLAPDTKIAADN